MLAFYLLYNVTGFSVVQQAIAVLGTLSGSCTSELHAAWSLGANVGFAWFLPPSNNSHHGGKGSGFPWCGTGHPWVAPQWSGQVQGARCNRLPTLKLAFSRCQACGQHDVTFLIVYNVTFLIVYTRMRIGAALFSDRVQTGFSQAGSKS